ncbi:MAG: hypothetical protein HKN54_04665 [Flavobacteriaceae bacterium]|nr:hypothetical protein [Flavobacteriaceae bacterium]
MNPSARGWIPKLLTALFNNKGYSRISVDNLYSGLREAGFIYGRSVKVVNDYLPAEDLTAEECSKINLLIALNSVYKNSELNQPFVKHLIEFYSGIDDYKTSLIGKIFGRKTSATTLEGIIHKRVQIDSNILTKNFNYFVTNALLYLDVLAYINFVKAGKVSEDYLKNLEATVEAVSYKVLQAKEQKNKYDDNLMELIESSLRYQDYHSIDYDEAITHLNYMTERRYLFDIGCMTSWGDHQIDAEEHVFLLELGKDLQLDNQQIQSAILSVNKFYSQHKGDISLLSTKNTVKNFYDNSSRMVSKLLSRNKKRLLKELKESKEVMRLISQSTIRDLSQEEQKQLQQQLLDIFKSIPSLAIFMLPGGALLLPLVIKFIPKLLPSAFDDNRIKE